MNATRLGRLLACCAAAWMLVACAATAPEPSPSPERPERNPELAEAARQLGEAYLAGGNLVAALRELKRADSLKPGDPVTLFDIGLVYYYRERYDQAIEHFEKALAIKPDFAPAMNSLGNAWLEKGEWDKAIAVYQKILEDAFYATPHFPLSNTGLAYYQKRDYAQAERYFQEALRIQPDFPNAVGGLAMTYNATGRHAEAALRLERAIKKHPGLPQLHYELGRAYRGMGEPDKAAAAFRRAVELAPESPLADEALRQLNALGK